MFLNLDVLYQTIIIKIMRLWYIKVQFLNINLIFYYGINFFINLAYFNPNLNCKNQNFLEIIIKFD